MTKPSAQLIARTLFTDWLRESLFFPLWWYSGGLKQVTSKTFSSIKGSVRFTGLDVWAKNLFVPMYGETGFTGRAISFGMRLVMIIVRGFGVVLWTLFVIAALGLYIIGFPILAILFFWHLMGVLF